MSFSNIVAPLALSALTALGALTATPYPGSESEVAGNAASNGETSSQIADTTNPTKEKAEDTVTAPMLGTTLRHGVDTTAMPCLDFYQYVNGDWRAKTRLGKAKDGGMRKADFFRDTYQRVEKRLDIILDSALSVMATTKDPTIKAVGVFYESCLVADSLERKIMPGVPPKTKTPPKDSTRKEQCTKRTIDNLGGALGQIFAQELFASHAIERMEHLLEMIRTSVMARLKANPLMNESERALAMERLQKLQLRVGIPKEKDMVDYTPLTAQLTRNYLDNTKIIANFYNKQWVNSIGGNFREQWKMGLLTPNASYSPSDHAIEIPSVMFMPPFFDATGEDAYNFGGIGMVIGHEIFHSLTSQLKNVENPEMAKQIERLKELNSSLGILDGWGTNGKRTYTEDVADLGGVLVAYDAWQATIKASKMKPKPLIEGFTPEQRFFLSIGRIWRSKWSGAGFNADVHAAPFARVNAMAMQSPMFSKAFGCKEGDPMVPSKDRLATIW